MESILEVDQLVKHYGGVHAVNGCTMSVRRGSITGLIGPNGAGKSTLIECVSGFQRIDSGRVFFNGRQIQKVAPHRIARLGLVRTFQSAREWPALTTLENLLIPLTPPRNEAVWRALIGRNALMAAESADRIRARELLAEFGLSQVKNELAGNLSGGQKRLLEFARIACAKPQMVLLDEPQTGVNPVLGERMAAAIRSLAGSGITVLIVEHNLPFIEELCSTVVVMNLGRQIAEGSMQELRGNPEVTDAYLGKATANV